MSSVSANHLLGLINDILDLSKIEAGKMEVTPSEFDLDPIVELCMRTVEPIAGGKDIALNHNSSGDIPRTVFAPLLVCTGGRGRSVGISRAPGASASVSFQNCICRS